MISFTTADLNAWIAAFFYPLARILALLVVAPPFNNVAINVRVRLLTGLAIALAIAPALPPLPAIEPSSGRGLLILAQQMLIGFAMGFVVRLVFSAIDMAGVMIGMQMGLGFATLYDPEDRSQTPVLSEFLGLVALLVFVTMNGHLLMIATLTQSFSLLPIGAPLPASASWRNVAGAGAIIFTSGLALSLPIVLALLITNVALGVLTRAAPQLNLFAVGFPLTLTLGFVMLILAIGHLSGPLQQLFEHGLQSMLGYFVPAGTGGG